MYPMPAAGAPHAQAHAVEKQVGLFVLQRRLMKRPHRLVQLAAQPRHRSARQVDAASLFATLRPVVNDNVFCLGNCADRVLLGFMFTG